MSHRGLLRLQRPWSVAFFVMVVLSAVTLPGCGGQEQQPQAPPPQAAGKTEAPRATLDKPMVSEDSYTALSEDQRARAKSLYLQHCSACHGEKGDTRGVAAAFLLPKPRDFTAGNFRLVSTTNGFPTMADIVDVLARGMPGSSMPPWPALSSEDRKLLAEQVVEFRRQAIRDREYAVAKEDGDEVDATELGELVQDLTTPGTVIEVPPITAATAESIARGKELYATQGCVKCHGKEGRGDGTENQIDVEGFPAHPRDLSRGIFKGSPDLRSVYIRTRAGMPGSPMPASPRLTHEQIADLVHFVLSLSDEQARAMAVLNREQIRVTLVSSIYETPDDPHWSDVAPVTVRLMPLWWRNEFPANVEVQAVHDVDSIALRLSWEDAEPDTHAAKTEAFEDAVAVELYRGEAEPFLGMGAAKTELEVWMWDADRQGGNLDVDAVNPNLVVDSYPFSEKAVTTAEYRRPGTQRSEQPDVSLPARASGNQIAPSQSPEILSATTLEAAGPGTVTFRPPISQIVNASGTWADGRWNVVMTRKLAATGGEEDFSIAPGERVSAAFAVWNGSARDRDGKKLISIWQDLVLDQ